MNLLDEVDWMSLPVDVKGTIYEELALLFSAIAVPFGPVQPLLFNFTLMSINFQIANVSEFGGSKSFIQSLAAVPFLFSLLFFSAEGDTGRPSACIRQMLLHAGPRNPPDIRRICSMWMMQHHSRIKAMRYLAHFICYTSFIAT